MPVILNKKFTHYQNISGNSEKEALAYMKQLAMDRCSSLNENITVFFTTAINSKKMFKGEVKLKFNTNPMFQLSTKCSKRSVNQEVNKPFFQLMQYFHTLSAYYKRNKYFYMFLFSFLSVFLSEIELFG